MRRGGLLLTRRGMSPLIATVLLMAFAVALGGMIMNWSVDIGVNDECASLPEAVTVTQFCTMDGNILLRAASSREAPSVQGIMIRVQTGDIENIVNVKNSGITPGKDIRLAIPVSTAEDSTVELIGVVGPKSKPFACKETPIERVDPIREC